MTALLSVLKKCRALIAAHCVEQVKDSSVFTLGSRFRILPTDQFNLYLSHCACSKYAQQYASLSDSTSFRPSTFQDAEHASKPVSGTCTHDAPSGDHKYMTELPVHTSNLACVGSHAMSVTLLFWSSTAVNSNFCISHTQTVVAMFSFKVTRYFPSLLQQTLPAYTVLLWHRLQYSSDTSISKMPQLSRVGPL